ncbi:uncharacterized protein LOC131619798 [Vicia villosa]|uniref:uncharacterized protein LOC131619798 n=1 Tax=Vicia villosa TaxID=3911 RepID=UPI00273AC523|nr:uncharacterized protein LOC131619798 [Vicia villosa]
MNRALLLKWEWRILREKNAIWSRFLEVRYHNPKLIVQVSSGGGLNKDDSIWWRDVIQNDLNPDIFDEGFSGCVKSILNKGDNILFWHSIWLGDQTLRGIFPELYDRSTKKLCTVEHISQFMDGVDLWNCSKLFAEAEIAASNSVLHLSTAEAAAGADSVGLQSQAAVLAQSLHDYWQQVMRDQNAEDLHVWILNGNDEFSVSSLTSLSEDNSDFAWTMDKVNNMRVIWNPSLPLRIKVVSWRFFAERIPVKDLMLQRGVSNFPTYDCVFCSAQPESLKHLFFDCLISKEVWKRIFIWMGEASHIYFQDFMCFESIQNKVKNSKIKASINVIWIATVWSLWIMRNSIIFEDKSYSFDEVFSNTLFLSWRWLGLSHKLAQDSFYVWYKRPLDCFKCN